MRQAFLSATASVASGRRANDLQHEVGTSEENTCLLEDGLGPVQTLEIDVN